MHKGNLLLIAAALGSGGAAAYLTSSYIDHQVATRRQQLESKYEPTRVVVPRHDLQAGAVLGYDNLAVRAIPRAFVPVNALLPDQVDGVVGSQLAVPVGAGEPLLRTLIASARVGSAASLLARGKRAVTLAVDQVSSVSGMIRPGDRVDILATLSSKGRTATVPLLQDVPVLATDNRLKTGLGGRSSRYQTVTLMLDPVAAARVSHARDAGELTVMLRPEAEEGTASIPRVTTEGLMAANSRKGPRQPKVQIILGGVQR